MHTFAMTDPHLPRFVNSAINFSTYAQMKTVLASTFPSLSPTHSGLVPVTHNGATAAAGAESSPYIHLGAAAIAGIVTSTATNPIWGESLVLHRFWQKRRASY
jgi:hypothetical protein